MLIRPTAPDEAAAGPKRPIYRSDHELALRGMVERWGRAKWPDARVCHELVMDRGTVRADLAFVSPDHLVAVEIKAPYDQTTRLLQQVGMFRLATPEVWICAAARHHSDADLVRYLLPSVGLLLTDMDRSVGAVPTDASLDEVCPADVVAPHPEAMLALLWVEELLAEALRHRLAQIRSGWTHAKLVKLLMRLDPEEQTAAVCRQLRARSAFWRADPPISDTA